MKKNGNGEMERRVNMNLMAKQVSQVHKAICTDDDGNEGWLTARVNKNTSDIKQIKTVWTTATVIATTLFHWLTRGK